MPAHSVIRFGSSDPEAFACSILPISTINSLSCMVFTRPRTAHQSAKSKRQFDVCKNFWRNNRWLQLSITKNGMNSSCKIPNFLRNSKNLNRVIR